MRCESQLICQLSMDDVYLTNFDPLRVGEVRAGARDGDRFVVVRRFDGEVTTEDLGRFAVRTVGDRHPVTLDPQATSTVVGELLAAAQFVLAHELGAPCGIARDDLLHVLRGHVLEFPWGLVQQQHVAWHPGLLLVVVARRFSVGREKPHGWFAADDVSRPPRSERPTILRRTSRPQIDTAGAYFGRKRGDAQRGAVTL